MEYSQFTCNCDVIHEDIVNDVKKKMQSKEECTDPQKLDLKI